MAKIIKYARSGGIWGGGGGGAGNRGIACDCIGIMYD